MLICVFVHSCFIENPLIAILLTNPLVSKVGMSHEHMRLEREGVRFGSNLG
jgi:hypothetical protein